jgi:protease I
MKKAIGLVVPMMLLSGLVHAQDALEAPPRVLLVVSPKDFTDKEYFDTKAVFLKAQADILVASTEQGLATSHEGRRIRVDTAISSLSVKDFEALVLVGGVGVLGALSSSEPLRNLVKSAVREQKVVAAICLAPVVLAKAGVLRNREATCYQAAPAIAELKRNGAIYIDQEVVTAGRVITANGPDTAAAFARAVLKEIEKAAAK